MALRWRWCSILGGGPAVFPRRTGLGSARRCKQGLVGFTLVATHRAAFYAYHKMELWRLGMENGIAPAVATKSREALLFLIKETICPLYPFEAGSKKKFSYFKPGCTQVYSTINHSQPCSSACSTSIRYRATASLRMSLSMSRVLGDEAWVRRR